MKNFARFIGLLVASFIILIIIGIIAILLSPILIPSIFLISSFVAIAFVVIAIIGFFSFFWYFAREEPKLKDSKDYSIDQGKEAK